MGRPLVTFTHLLDTATVLWLVEDTPRLSRPAFHICNDPDTNPAVSVVSFMELVIKANRGKLLLNPDPIQWWNRNVRGGRFNILPLYQHHVEHLWKLHAFHNDPFDRLLVSQALAERIPLVTPDVHLRQYPAEVIW